MYATAIVPAILVVMGRRQHQRQRPLAGDPGPQEPRPKPRSRRLLEREPPYPKQVRLTDLPATSKPRWRACAARRLASSSSYCPHRRATILASVPWFLQDLGTYGIGIFTPTILVTGDRPRGRRPAQRDAP